jgi:pteridine reductase
MNDKFKKWALVTGGAKRIGATIAETLHNNGFNVAIHYNSSRMGKLKLLFFS